MTNVKNIAESTIKQTKKENRDQNRAKKRNYQEIRSATAKFYGQLFAYKELEKGVQKTKEPAGKAADAKEITALEGKLATLRAELPGKISALEEKNKQQVEQERGETKKKADGFLSQIEQEKTGLKNKIDQLNGQIKKEEQDFVDKKAKLQGQITETRKSGKEKFAIERAVESIETQIRSDKYNSEQRIESLNAQIRNEKYQSGQRADSITSQINSEKYQSGQRLDSIAYTIASQKNTLELEIVSLEKSLGSLKVSPEEQRLAPLVVAKHYLLEEYQKIIGKGISAADEASLLKGIHKGPMKTGLALTGAAAVLDTALSVLAGNEFVSTIVSNVMMYGESLLSPAVAIAAAVVGAAATGIAYLAKAARRNKVLKSTEIPTLLESLQNSLKLEPAKSSQVVSIFAEARKVTVAKPSDGNTYYIDCTGPGGAQAFKAAQGNA